MESSTDSTAAMADTPLTALDPIYSVYIHHKTNSAEENLICWERRQATPDRREAINSARSLLQCYDCEKIEVLKTFHDPKLNKRIEKTIKVYGGEEMEDISLTLKAALLILCFALLLSGGLWGYKHSIPEDRIIAQTDTPSILEKVDKAGIQP